MWIEFAITANIINLLFFKFINNNHNINFSLGYKKYLFLQSTILSYLVTYHLFYEI